MRRRNQIWILLVLGATLLAACTGSGVTSDLTFESEGEVESYHIITLLPKDAIPSIDNPQFYSAGEADEEYVPEELVIGVEFEGEARAYPIGLLSSREIVNDNVRGVPIAVTW